MMPLPLYFKLEILKYFFFLKHNYSARDNYAVAHSSSAISIPWFYYFSPMLSPESKPFSPFFKIIPMSVSIHPSAHPNIYYPCCEPGLLLSVGDKHEPYTCGLRILQSSGETRFPSFNTVFHEHDVEVVAGDPGSWTLA